MRMAGPGEVAPGGDQVVARLPGEDQAERGRDHAADQRSGDHGRDAEREDGGGLGGAHRLRVERMSQARPAASALRSQCPSWL